MYIEAQATTFEVPKGRKTKKFKRLPMICTEDVNVDICVHHIAVSIHGRDDSITMYLHNKTDANQFATMIMQAAKDFDTLWETVKQERADAAAEAKEMAGAK